MSFNNGYERKKFNNKQASLQKKYRAYGMSEQAIKEMYEFDYEWFKSQRRYAMNTCNGGKQLLYAVGAETVESGLPLLDQIENEAIFLCLSNMSEDYLQIIDLLDKGYSAEEIASIRCTNGDYIRKKIARIRKRIKIFLK